MPLRDGKLRSRGLQSDRAHRADFDAAPTVLTGAFRLLTDSIEGDHGLKPSPGVIHFRSAFLGSTNPHTPSTQNATIGIVVHDRMVFHDFGYFEVALKSLQFQTHAKEFGQVLKRAPLVCRAVSAVHIMNREQKPKGASLQVSDGGGVGLDNQWREDPDRAGRNRFSLDFDETQPARCLWVLHAFEVAEVRDENVMTQAGFEQDSPLLDFKLFMIY
jgi:hypothetical protein